jgi:lipoteichoic acid synthase
MTLLVTAALLLKTLIFVPLAGLPLEARQVLMSVGAVLILVAWLPLIRRPWRSLAAGLVSAGVGVLLLADLWHNRYFGDVLSVRALGQWRNLGGLGASVAELVRPVDLLFVVDLPLFGWLAWRHRRAPGRPAGSARPARRAAGAMILAGLLLMAAPVTERLAKQGPSLYRNLWSQTYFVRQCGVLSFHLVDAWRFARDHLLSPAIVSDASRAALDRWEQAAGPRHRAPGPAPGAAEGKSLILLQVEALQDHVLDLSVGDQEVTPYLNGLARRSLRFTRFHHQAARGRTADAEFAVLCSQHPLEVGSVFFRFPEVRRVCLPELLRDAGYATAAFHANHPNYWNRQAVYPRMGFDRFYSEADFELTREIGMGMADGPFLEQVVGHIRSLPRPFLAHVLTLTSHHPFWMPKDERALDLGDWDHTGIGGYLQSVRYVDGALERFEAGLRAAGLWEDVVLVLYGDHDMGTLSDPGPIERLFGPIGAGTLAGLDFRRRVPLLIHLPDDAGAGPRRAAVGQVDLAPTLLGLLGLPAYHRGFLGADMLTSPRRPVVLRDGSAVADGLWFHAAASGASMEGACFSQGGGERVPVERCATIAEHARETLALSDVLVRQGVP